MKREARDLSLSSESTDAAELFDCAVEHYLKFHADPRRRAGEAGDRRHPVSDSAEDIQGRLELMDNAQ